jgi:predicted DCC family thiol-disulfide oxidoreductase YuxK
MGKGSALSPQSASATGAEAAPALLFYDGECGICHWIVRFVVERDRRSRFRFAPIGGTAFVNEVASRLDEPYPDSVMLALADGRLLLRSDAAIAILSELGGSWASWGRVLAAVPRPVRDLGYRWVARVRRLLTRRPESACPRLPPELASRFDP